MQNDQRAEDEQQDGERVEEPEVERLIEIDVTHPVGKAAAVLGGFGEDVAALGDGLGALAEGVEKDRNAGAHADAFVAQVETVKEVGGATCAGEDDGDEQLLGGEAGLAVADVDDPLAQLDEAGPGSDADSDD